MALFRPYNRDAGTPAAPSTEVGAANRPPKKGVPTPTRQQAEAARRQRLTPPTSAKGDRAKVRRVNQTARAKALEALDQRPERVLLRDYVDRRWNLGEFMMPVMLLVLALTMYFGANEALVQYVAFGTWLILFVVLFDLWYMWRGFKAVLDQRLPGTSTKGLLSYGVNRAIQIRRWRIPGPRIKRGEEF